MSDLREEDKQPNATDSISILHEVSNIGLYDRASILSYQDALSKSIKREMTDEQAANIAEGFSGAPDDLAKAVNDNFIEAKTAAIPARDGEWQRVKTIQYVVTFHRYIRSRRERLIQPIKTQVGINPANDVPTISTAASKNAAAASGFRHFHNNKSDPIKPIFNAAVGQGGPVRPPPSASGGFDEPMCDLMVRAVKSMMSVEAQDRVPRRHRPH